MIHSRVEQHVCVPPSLLSSKLHSLQVVVVDLSHVISAEALSFKLFIFMHLALGDFSIIVLVPLLVACFISAMKTNFQLPVLTLTQRYSLVKYVTVVMTARGLTTVNNDSSQLILGWLGLFFTFVNVSYFPFELR